MTGIEIATVIGLIVKVAVEQGIPAVLALLQAWQKQDPNFEDIDKLHELVKKPESYFQ